ncbi:YbaN family protein [Lacrimispora amygdalina]
MLLTLYCFAKGSEKLSLRFRETSLYKKYIAEYVQTRSLTVKQKLYVQIFAGGMMVASFIFLENWILKIILGLLFIIHNWVFIFKIKTRKSKWYDMKKVEVQNNGI